MDSKKLQVYVSFAEVVSAIAVVLSLVYLGNEVRHASTMDSREADLLLFERVQRVHRLVIESPGLAEIIVTAEASPQDLAPADRLRYLTYEHEWYNSWEVGFNSHAEGILDDEDWRSWKEWFTQEARRQPRFGWVENRQHFTGSEFREHADSLLVPR